MTLPRQAPSPLHRAMTAPAVPAKKRQKPSGNSSGRPRRDPVPQPHGGALIPGAGGGPQPGAGRPKSEVKAALRLSFEKRIPVLEQIADSVDEQAKDRIRAVDTLAKYSEIAEPDQSDISQHPDARRFLAAVHQAISETVSPHVAERIMGRIETLMSNPFGSQAA